MMNSAAAKAACRWDDAHDKDDMLTRRDAAIAVDGGNAHQRPAARGFLGDTLEFLLRHAGIVLELQRGEAALLGAA